MSGIYFKDNLMGGKWVRGYRLNKIDHELSRYFQLWCTLSDEYIAFHYTVLFTCLKFSIIKDKQCKL